MQLAQHTTSTSRPFSSSRTSQRAGRSRQCVVTRAEAVTIPAPFKTVSCAAVLRPGHQQLQPIMAGLLVVL